MEVNIKVKLNGSAQGCTAVIPVLKYNKSKGWFCFEFDDGSVSAKHTLAKMKATTFTDGCGNNKPYTAGIALNARFGYDNAEIGLQTDEARESMNYTDQFNFINEGWDLMNHSYYHEINSSQTGSPVWGYGNDPQRNINELDALILSKHKYKMNAMVVPSDYAGFMTAAKNIGYLGGCSTGTFDGNLIIDQYRWAQRVNQLTNQNYYAIKREFAISGWGSTTVEPWQRVNDMVNDTEKGLIDIGTHTMNTSEETNFRNWIQSIKDRLGDSILFTSLREFLEYQHLRFNVVKTETIVGNELHIKLDYSNVPNQFISWYDLSLSINTSATIQSIEVDNGLFSNSFSNANKLVNINFRRTDFVADLVPPIVVPPTLQMVYGYTATVFTPAPPVVSDPDLLSGFTRIVPAPSNFSTVDNKTYTQIANYDNVITLNQTFSGDVTVLVKFNNAIPSGSYGCDLLLAPSTAGDPYVDVYFNDDNNIRVSQGNGDTNVGALNINNWYGFKRVGNNIKFVSTLDGITYTNIYDFGSKTGYNYLMTYGWGGANPKPILHNPQFKLG